MGGAQVRLLRRAVVAGIIAVVATSGVGAAGATTPKAAGAGVAGKAWTAVQIPDPFATSELNGIGCTSASACTAVGGATARKTSPSAPSAPSAPPGSAPSRSVSSISSPIRRLIGSSDRAALRLGLLRAHAAAASPTREFAFVERWNGRRWTLQHLPSLPGRRIVELLGVSCPAVDDCIAVGVAVSPPDAPTPVAFRWDGKRWSKLTIPSDPTFFYLTSVKCTSIDFCVAVGDGYHGSADSVTPPSEIWNGHKWTQTLMQGVQNGLPELNGVSCSSATACTAVGSDYDFEVNSTTSNPTLIERWNGVRWRIQASPVKQVQLAAVSCTGRLDCTAVGALSRGLKDVQSVEVAEAWHGSAWHALVGVSRQHAALYGVSCLAASCVAVGAQDIPPSGGVVTGRTLVQAGGRTPWTMQPTPSVAHEDRWLYAVKCTTAQVCIAVGSRSDKLLVERN
jgi:hypothetical protein